MAWPTVAITTANLDSDSDSPKLARPDLLAAVSAVNAMISAGGIPTGALTPFAGSSAPTGWLLCYGQAVSRTTYADLFAVIGTTYGSGDGSTTFSLPDMRGRVAAGRDNMGGTTAGRITSAGSGIVGTTLGAAGGAQTHTLTTAQIPSHTHGMTQAMPALTNAAGSVNRASSNTPANASGTSDATGGGGAHNNTQPTIILTYIIKT